MRLLSEIVQRISVEHEQDRILFIFHADLEFHDRLCVWGAAGEDLEDDTPLEESGGLEACM